MKKVYLTAVLMLFAFVSFSQNAQSPLEANAFEKKISQLDLTSSDVYKKFYNANREELKTLEGAKFIQIMKKNKKGLWDVSEFYADGFLKMEGTVKDVKSQVKEGKFRFYKKDGTIDYEGVYGDDTPDGEWRFYFPNGQLSAIESYENGTRTRQDYWNEDGSALTDTKAAEKLLPSYTGGQYQMNDFIKNNLRLPSDSSHGKVSGKVVVSFWVNEKGEVISPKIEESLGEVADNEVIRVVKSMPKWIPAKQHNRPYKQMYIMPVTFN